MYCEVNVGERIRYFRNLRGWSQETLALQAEINPAFLGHLERGLKSPTIKTLEKIVRALDISLAELFADPQPVDNAKDAVIAQPSPPSGPPNGLNFSRLNEATPLPPFPAITSIFASSMNFMNVSGQYEKALPAAEPSPDLKRLA